MAHFTKLLAQHHIEAVADVRSAPHSRRHPQFNRDAMNRLCGQPGIAEDLLRSPEEMENDAYAAQEERIAYSNVKAGVW